MKLIIMLITMILITGKTHAKVADPPSVNVKDQYKSCVYMGHSLKWKSHRELRSICKKGYTVRYIVDGGSNDLTIINLFIDDGISELCDFEKQIIVNYPTKSNKVGTFICKFKY